MDGLGSRLVVVVLVGSALGCGVGEPPSRSAASHARPASASGAGPAWERDLSAALRRGGKENKVVMVDFYTDWCKWCDKLDQTTFSDEKVLRALDGVVAVKLNAEDGGRTEAERLGVEGYPTVVFFDANGKEVGRIPGYLPPGEFLEQLEDIVRHG